MSTMDELKELKKAGKIKLSNAKIKELADAMDESGKESARQIFDKFIEDTVRKLKKEK